jgi:hypothetical protein
MRHWTPEERARQSQLPNLEAVGAIHRSKDSEGKGEVKNERLEAWQALC